jgi:predicted RNA-binding protein with PUA domain
LSAEAAPGAVDAATLRRQYFPVVMKPLLKRFADPSERCRELAVVLVRGRGVGVGCVHASEATCVMA